MPISHNRHPNAFLKRYISKINISYNDPPLEINNFPHNLSLQLPTKGPISEELDRHRRSRGTIETVEGIQEDREIQEGSAHGGSED